MACDRIGLGASLAVMLAMLGATEARAAAPPVRIEVERAAGAVTILIVGAADQPLRARYDLAVKGASRLRQSGGVTLRPGHRVVAARVRIDDRAPWHAELEVTPEGGEAYRLTAASDH